MTTTVAISSGTTAATSSDIAVDSGSAIQVWTDVTLGAGDSVSVFRTDDGGTEEVAVQENGAPVFLSTSRTSVMLNGPAVYRLKRSAVSAAVTVYYDE